MSVRLSGALSAQQRIFDVPAEQRPAYLLEHVLEPMRGALLPPPGMGGDVAPDLLAVARQYGFIDPSGDPAVYAAGFRLLNEARTEERCREILARAERALDPHAHGIDVEILGHVVVADPLQSQQLDADDGYTGYGGHSGHAIVHANVALRNVSRIPAALAHEYHHNVRLRYEPWTRETTVGQYAILEGLAEAFAVELCGEECAGPWVTRQTPEERSRAREIISGALEVTGWNEIRSYIFGDWVAEQCGRPKLGLVKSAGYAVGYDWVRTYCAATGCTVAEATYVPWREIAGAVSAGPLDAG